MAPLYWLRTPEQWLQCTSYMYGEVAENFSTSDKFEHTCGESHQQIIT